MNSPVLLLLVVIAAASASLAHLLWGQRWVQLPVFLLAALAGCIIVYVTRLQLPLDLPRPAGVPILEVVLGAWLFLIVASRLRL